MKKVLLLFMLIAAAIGARGQSQQPTLPNAMVGNLFYIFDAATKTAQVGSSAYWAKPQYTIFYSGDITVPETVTYEGNTYTVSSIATYAFCDYNGGLTSVTLPNTITTLDASAFYCTVIKTLTIPNSVKTIGETCFAYSGLQSITIGSGVESIGKNAFQNSSSLTDVKIEAATPPTIDATTFPAAIKSKITLTVPKGKLSAYQSAANWSGFKAYKEAEGGGTGGGGGDDTEPAKIEVDGIYYQTDPATGTATVISGYQAGITQTPYSGVVTVPSTFTYKGKTYTVTAVGQAAFQHATCTEVTLPSTCTTLARYAFDSMTSLVKLDLGGVNDIPGNGIANCTALKDLYIGYSGGVVGTVGASIAAAMRANINVHVPSAALQASYKGSSFWAAARAILIPEQLQIGDLYYQYYPAQKTAMVLAPYEIPGNGAPKQIGPAVEIPSAITIGTDTYTVTNLQAGVFYETPNVTSVKMNEGLKNIEYETFYMTDVTELEFPNSLENIEYRNFYYCQKLTKVTFGSGLKTMGTNSFYKADKMTDIIINAQTPPTVQGGSGAIFSTDFNKGNVTLTVPAGTLNAYKTDANWSGFKEYKEIGGGTGGEETKVEVDGIYYELDNAASTATVINGYQAGMTETPYTGVITVPATFTRNNKTYTVTAVGQAAFQRATCTEVTLPSTCTTLARYAFDSMTSLVKLDLGGVNDIPGNGIANCTALKDLYIGYSGGVVGTVGASIAAAMRSNINVHVPSAALQASYKGSSFWAAARAILIPEQLQIGDLYYQYYPAQKTAMVLAPYEIPGNGAPKQIGPAVEIPSVITVGTDTYTVTNLQAGVFYETPNVTSVKMNEGLKNIEYETFYMTDVTELEFPNSLENIEESNFYYCTKLTKVTFGSGLKTMGTNSFYKSDKVTDIIINAQTPPAVQGGSGAIFYSGFNKGNVTLTVPAGKAAVYKADANWSGFKEYKEIGGGPIEEGRIVVDGIHYEITKTPYAAEEGTLQCYVVSPVESGLPNGDEYSGVINIPDFISYNNKKYAVVQIKQQSFYMQSAVTEVRIPTIVTTIWSQAFQESGITTVTIPASVNRIDNYAFRKCSSLKTMTAKALTPATVSSGTFNGITSTCKLYVPRGCVNAYKNANYWKDFASIEEDPNSAILPTSVTITGMPRTMLVGDTVRLGVVILPENTTDKSVEWKSLTPEVATVDSTGFVTVIGTGNALIEVICNGNRTLSNNANVVCVTREAVIDGVSYRFQLNEKARIANAYVIRPKSGSYSGVVTIPSYVQHGSTFKVRGIDANSFALMTGVTAVAIPATVDTVGYDAFRNCSALKRIDITSLTSWANIDFKNERSTPFSNVGVGMYLNNQPVTEVRIGGTVSIIKPFVFQGIGSITNLTIDEGVRQISNTAFKNCTGLVSVTLPNSIDSIGLHVFNGCTALVKANIPARVKVIAGGLFTGSGLTSIVIPDSVYLIDNQAFQNCASLKSVNIGSGVKKLNLMVFDGCSQLDTVTVNAITPPEFFQASVPGQSLNPFDPSIYPKCRLYVPAESVEAYKGADVWKNFSNIRAIGSSDGVKAVIDGISYELFADDSTATVLASPVYTGEVTVPATVTHDGKTYNITAIAPRAFYGTTIDILRLPANIKAIPEEMAANCQKLISVGLPDSLETIGVRAFYGSPNIRFIRCVNYGKNHNLVPPSFTATAESDYGQAFSPDIWPDCMLAIPAGMFMNYKECAGWKNFRSFGYWHDTDVSPISVTFSGKFSGEERKVRTLTPITMPENATILNFIIRNSNPEVVSFATDKDDNNKAVLKASLLKAGEADVTVYMNLVKTSFKITVSVYTGVEGIDDDEAPARYFTLDGFEVVHPQKGVMYIKVQENKSTKVIF